MLDGEADRRQRVLDLVRDDPRHFRPGGEPVRAHDVGHVLDHGHPRTLAAQGKRHRDDAPPLPGPGLDLDGETRPRRERSRIRRTSRHALSREDLLERRAVRASAAERRRRRVGEQHAPVLAVRDDARGQVGEQRREPLLLPQQRVGLGFQAARHGEEGAHELLQLLVRRLRQAGREVAARDRAGPFDEIGNRARDPQRQAARDERRRRGTRAG